MADLTGMTLGPYRIVERIGRGGMATVYKAFHAAMNRHVAIKVLPEEFADDPGFRARFERESQTVAQLQHPHILPVFDYGEERGISYLVMPYIPTGTLKEYMAQEGQLPLDEAARILTRLAEALDYAHRQGVIHRDIKPDNVLFDEDGNALLTDFGLTRMVEGGASLTGTGVIGTPAYMSPEQGQGMRLDHRSDIYSLGIILYEMVTGDVPFSADTPIAVIYKHINAPLPLPRAMRPDLPEAAENVILKALAKEPDQRWASCVEMAEAFARAIAEHPVEFTPVSPVSEIEKRETTAGIQPVVPEPMEDVDTQLLPTTKAGVPKWVWVLILVLAVALVIVFVSGVLSPAEEAEPTQAAAIAATDTLTAPSAPTATLTATDTPASETAPPTPVAPSPTITVSPASQHTATLSATDIEGTVMAQVAAAQTESAATGMALNAQTAAVLTATTQAEDRATQTAEAFQMQTSAALTATATHWTPTPTADIQATVDARLTAIATLWTATPVPTWQPIQELAELEGHGPYVYNVRFSPDGSLLASSGADAIVRLRDGHTGAELARLEGHSGWIPSVAFSPDGTILASGSNDNTVRLWDVRTGGLLAVLVGHTGDVESVAFNPEGTVLASAGDTQDPIIILWDVQSRAVLATLQGHTKGITSSAFSPDGGVLVSASADHTIRFWDVGNYTERLVLEEAHADAVSAVRFSPDGMVLASGGEDGMVRLWNAQTGELMRTYRIGIGQDIQSLAFSPDGTILAVGQSFQITLVDVASGNLLSQWREDSGWTWSVDFNPDGTLLATGGWDGFIRLWEVSDYVTGTVPVTTPVAIATEIAPAAVTEQPVPVAPITAANARFIRELMTMEGHTDIINAVAVSPDGTLIASGSWDQTIRLWDNDESSPTYGEQIASLEWDGGWINRLAFHPDGALLISGDTGGSRVWDVDRSSPTFGTEVTRLATRGGTGISMASSQDGAIAASAVADDTIWIFDIASGLNLAVLDGYSARSMAFSPNGTVLYAAADVWDDYIIRQIDWVTGEELGALAGHDMEVEDLVFSPDGSTLASSSAGGIRLWDVATGETRATLSGIPFAEGIAFSPDGTVLAVGCSQGVRLYDAQTGAELSSLPQYTAWVEDVAFSPDGMTLVSGSKDMTVRLWAIQDQIATAGPTPGPTETSTAGYSSNNPITSNDQWVPVVQDFNGVEMVLVPAGCFQMGNDPDAYNGAEDGGHQCFDAPFWIDRYEVTNEQFAAFLTAQGNTSDEGFEYLDVNDEDARIQQMDGQWQVIGDYTEHSVTEVNWFGARDYCAWHGGQLPTEAQWEYAARGPDELYFPWGDEFSWDNVVGNTSGTVAVGSNHAGISWVGAYDLSGNVWEWTHSLYQGYPYNDTDGRESDTDTKSDRVLHGGSWRNGSTRFFRAAFRIINPPDSLLNAVGFRCARVYDPGVGDIQPSPAEPTEVAAQPDTLGMLGYSAANPVTSNDQWTPVIQSFNGVEMVLAPAGCFQMGSTDAQVDAAFAMCEEERGQGNCERGWFTFAEQPLTQICFNEPFWIDRYEVTNSQYGSSGRWSGDNLPRETVNWPDAKAHCESWGGRLPTEAEWEYAARGPDALIFPWGNTFDGSWLNFCDTNCEFAHRDTGSDDGYQHTAPVGSLPMAYPGWGRMI